MERGQGPGEARQGPGSGPRVPAEGPAGRGRAAAPGPPLPEGRRPGRLRLARDLEGVREKIREELAELDEAVAGGDARAVEHEVGDLLFSVANLARKLDVAPDVALRRANARFRSRFHAVEAAFAGDRDRLAAASLEELEAAWQAAKSAERGGA
ncbi:MAG: hypothetical protein C0395_02830 [Gemmatimonas sp.]|nr:hypothetical protein [Gemmatimonas sp.]